MANLKVGNTTIGKIAVIEPYEDVYVDDTPTPITPWTRPSHWLDMPTISEDEHKCAFLYAIPSGSLPSGNLLNNYVLLHARGPGSSNDYKTDTVVDWGDGTTDTRNTLSNSVDWFEKFFDFDSLPIETQFVEDGRYYRQALVTIEGNSGIRDINWRSRKNYPGGSTYWPNLYLLEYNINVPSGINIGLSTNYDRWRFPFLEKARVYAPLTWGYICLFQHTPRLKSVELYSGAMPSLTSTKQMFSNSSIDYLPDFDTSNVTSFSSMFSSYRGGAKEFPSGKYDFSSVSATGMSSLFYNSSFEKITIDIPSHITNCSNVFGYCNNLKKIEGNWDTSNVTTFNAFAQQCINLLYTPDIKFDSTVDMYRIFWNCRKLKNHYTINASGCTNAQSAFSSCYSITEVTIEDLSNYTNDGTINNGYFNSMFSSCINLKKVNVINPKIGAYRTSYGVGSMFSSCVSLEYLPYLDLSGVQTVNSIVSNCTSLKKVGGFNTPDTTDFTSMFYNCHYLQEAPELDMTCRGTGNVSIASLFRDCRSLKTLPQYDFSRVYYFEIWSPPYLEGSISLDLSNLKYTINSRAQAGQVLIGRGNVTEITDLIIPSGANMNTAFSNMINLKSIPFVDASNGYTYAGMFNGCSNLEAGALSGTNVSIGYYQTALGSGAVMDVFNNLASGVTGQTIDMRYAPGVYVLTEEERNIPISKGWTLLT